MNITECDGYKKLMIDINRDLEKPTGHDPMVKEEIIEILEHGFRILAKNKLKCFPFTLYFARSLYANTCGVDAYDLPDGNVAWSDWKLIWNGHEYHSKFKSFAEWKSFYQNGGK